ncbi:MAG TPA: NUDIX hydrolase [Chromatiaceae bacterium]|jgi:8-oxo-dGTP pyrophosphatase MutT (NUDIX family)|nr:NUDIX hydrolase [Chromatiaceae bacterium]HIN81656.1 NUDIX hydrolase [Chromatiales bacterium]
MDTTWRPHVTVAAVTEQDGRFLMVEEMSSGKVVLNQPAGHLDEGENLIDAIIRETLEETAWTFEATGIISIDLWQNPQKVLTFLRVNFSGDCIRHEPHRPLDDGILRALWLTPDEIDARTDQLRSPMVQRCIHNYLAGKMYPLDMLSDLLDHPALIQSQA